MRRLCFHGKRLIWMVEIDLHAFIQPNDAYLDRNDEQDCEAHVHLLSSVVGFTQTARLVVGLVPTRHFDLQATV